MNVGKIAVYFQSLNLWDWVAVEFTHYVLSVLFVLFIHSILSVT